MDLEMESDGTRDEFRCITYKYVAFKIRNGKMFGEQCCYRGRGTDFEDALFEPAPRYLSIILSTHYNSDQGLIAAERKIDVRGRVEEEGRSAQINQKAITDKGQRRKKHSVED